MSAGDPTALTYLSRRGVAAQWRGFLRALVEELDDRLDLETRDGLLRAVGARLAAGLPLPACGSLGELEARINEALAAADWGYVQIGLDMGDRALTFQHCAAPAVATRTDPTGGWVGAVLEGLYGAWMASQPGAEPGLTPLRVGGTPAMLTLRYGRS